MEPSWRDIESYWGVAIPPTFKDAYDAAASRESEFFCLFSKAELLRGEELSPSMPLRFLPLSISARGDHLGLYYPRVGACFVAQLYIETGVLKPVSSRAEIIVDSPDQFDGWPEDVYEQPPDLSANVDWKTLVMRYPSEDPLAELLKPMVLNSPFMDAIGTPDFERLMRAIDDGSENIATRIFRSPTDGYMVKNWRAFAKEIEAQGNRSLALAALQNASFLLWLYPHHGFSERNGDTWGELKMIFHSMSRLSLDAFDAKIVNHWAGNLDQWLAEAEAEE